MACCVMCIPGYGSIYERKSTQFSHGEGEEDGGDLEDFLID